MNRISELRKEKNLNQTGLALALNVSQYTVSAIETGRQQPTADMLITLSDFFGVSIDYILCRSEIRYRSDDMHSNSLSPKALEILDLFKSLNESGQERAIGIVFALKNMK